MEAASPGGLFQFQRSRASELPAAVSRQVASFLYNFQSIVGEPHGYHCLDFIAQIDGGPLHIYGWFTLPIRVCSTIGSMSDDEHSRAGANLLLLCLAALIFGAVLFMGFELTAF
jgi:hypothetical protein